MALRSTAALRSRGAYTLLKGERVLTHNLIVGTGTIIAGLLGVAFQSLFSHRLQPADYGSVFVVVSLITFIGLPASAFTLAMAREASRDRASGQKAASASLLRNGNRTLLLVGVALGIVLAVLSPLLAQFFAVPANLLLAAAAGIPFTLALPLLLGEFQGEQQFLAFSTVSVGQAALKLVSALALGAVWGPFGIIAGISLASGGAYLVAVLMLSRKFAVRTSRPWIKGTTSYLVVIVPSTLALAVLVSADVLLVKHYFPIRIAGEFAAVAALGRAIFWGSSAIATVLFPKVVFRGARGEGGSHLVGASLLLVAFGGLVGLGMLAFGSHWLLVGFAGNAYAEAATYLPWYGIGMIMLGGVAVLIATHQSRGKPDFLAVLLPLTLLEPVLLVAFHSSVTQVVAVVDISMTLVVVGLGALYLIQSDIRHQSLILATGNSSAGADMAKEPVST
jgi:O-antigen/teichoic acid export membrane protein